MKTESKQKPILFSTAMVRAILDGRKTQTRRMVNPQPIPDRYHPDTRLEWNPGRIHYTECNCNWNPISNAFADYIRNGHCPYGKPGDRLWVREAWQIGTTKTGEACVVYRSDNAALEALAEADGTGDFIAIGNPVDPVVPKVWRPSIHMPRWANRLTLEITSIRVERLNDISDEDAKSEGVESVGRAGGEDFAWRLYGPNATGCTNKASDSFESLWLSINGAGSWSVNPWVWVIEFRKV